MGLFSKKKELWFPLDNAAKIYPPTASQKRAHVFCFSALLDNEIQSDFLIKAIENVLNHYPTFMTSLKRGAFWYYLEENKKPIKVFVETPYYLKQIDYKENNGYLFQVLHVRNKITIKFFHALTDGSGGFTFFTEVLTQYLKLIGHDIDLEGMVKPVDEPYHLSSADDSFLRYDKNIKEAQDKIPRPYAVTGTPFDYDGCGMITAEIDLDDVKELAKEQDVSITAYLSALYAQSVNESFLKNRPHGNKLVSVLVPCNLRKKYGGETMRNFTMFSRVMIDYKKPHTLEECAKTASKQILNGLTEENLDKIIHDNVKLEKNFFIKITPLFLKNLVMRIVYSRVGEVLQTVCFSNIGLVNLPESVSSHVKALTFAITPTFSCGHQVGVLGYNGKLYVTFTRNFVETTIEKNFVRQLTAKGVKVKVHSNYWESKL